MEKPSKQPKNQEKVGEKRPRIDLQTSSDDDSIPLVRRSSRNKSSKTPAEGPGKHAKPPQRSTVPVRIGRSNNGNLPKLIFAPDEIPSDGRINIASRPDLICKVKKALLGTEEWDILLGSDFGKLFTLSTVLSATSGKVIHQFLCRMLVTIKKHEIWFVFGGKPMRFGLMEFANVTGLNCGPLPSTDEQNRLKKTPRGQKAYWDTLLTPLFGRKKKLVAGDIMDVLSGDLTHPSGRFLTGQTRLALALIVLIDGVISPPTSSPIVREETVEMMKDLNAVLSYPWGRESFNQTLRMVILGEEYKTVEELRTRLSTQSHLSIHGFPLAIQLAVFKAIPMLHSLLPKNKQATDLMSPDVDTVGYLRNIRTDGIIKIEQSADLLVHPFIEFGFDLANDDLSWPDERQDTAIENVIERIRNGFKFLPSHWQVWGKDQVPNPSPRKQVSGKKTSKPTPSKGAGTSKPAQDNVSDRYVGEEVLNVLSINWGNPDDGVPALIKWLEDERDGDLAARTKWWTQQQESDLADRTKWWAGHIERLIASYCSYHSDKVGEKSQGVGEKGQQDRQDTSAELKNQVDKQNTQGLKALEEEEWDRLQTELHEHLQPEVNETQAYDNQTREGDIIQTNVDSRQESGYVTPPRQMEKDQPLVQTPQPSTHYTSPPDMNLPNPSEAMHEDSSEGSSTEDGSPRKEINEPVQSQPPNVSINEVPVMDIDSDRGLRQTSEIIEVVRSEEKIMDEDIVGNPSDSGDEAQQNESVSDKFGGDNTSQHNLPEEVNETVQPTPEEYNVGGGIEGVENYLLDDPVDSNDDNKEPIGDLLQPEGDCFEYPVEKSTETHENKSSAKKKRERKKPKRLLEETSGKKQVHGGRKLSKVFLSMLKKDEESEYNVNNVQVTKKFFEQLYTPSNHVSNEHIEAVLSVIWKRHSEALLQDRVAILDTLFTAAVEKDYKHFSKLRSGHDKFAWNKVIQRYVKGDVEGRGLGLAWVADVDEVYMPMFWQKNHWVAICINLRTGWVHIMDSNRDYTKDPKVEDAMKPLLSSLPHILKAYVDQENCLYDVPEEFVCERLPEVPQNARSGDCGLLSVNFIERLCQNLSLEPMDDAAVDKMRMNYAIQVYESFVKPLTS